MVRGRAAHQRSMLVAQAALVWITASADELTEFIETGEMPEQGDGGGAVFPYDPDALKQMVEARK